MDNLEIANINTIMNATLSGEAAAILAEFKIALNAYLKDLVASPVRSLADVIAFNQRYSNVVYIHHKSFLYTTLILKCGMKNVK